MEMQTHLSKKTNSVNDYDCREHPAPTCQLSHMKVLVLNTLGNAFDKFRK